MPLTDVNTTLPRIKLSRPVETRQLAQQVNQASTFSVADVYGSILAVAQAMTHALESASPVRLEGIGLFRPSIKLNGKITVKFKPDKQLLMALNQSRTIRVHIQNKKYLGMSLEELTRITTDSAD
jgi:predicted histone-like DNA-binding protein